MDVHDLEVEDQRVFFKTSEQMTEIADGTVDLIITSPPYWNLKDYDDPDQIGQEDYDKYLERMNTVWRECARVSKDCAVLAINLGSRRVKGRYMPIGWDVYGHMPEEWQLIDNLIWYIPNALPQPRWYIDRLFDNKYENVMIFAKNTDYDYAFNKVRVKQKYADKDPREEKKHPEGRCIGNVIRIPAYRPPNIKEIGYYLAGYPEELVYLIAHVFSNQGDAILDPFLGSGTTLKVARNIKRKGIGYETNHRLRPVIERRIREDWPPPPFETMDIIHSSNNVPGSRREGIRRPDLKAKKHVRLEGDATTVDSFSGDQQ